MKRWPISLSFVPAALAGATLCLAATVPVGLLGDPAPSAAAGRAIVIGPTTKWVNVTGGEIVNFVVGDKSFAWSFYVGRSVNSFPLNQVAPPGVLDHEVTVYMAPDPSYMGGNGGGHGKK